MGLKLPSLPNGIDNDTRRFMRMVVEALRELDGRAGGGSGGSDANAAAVAALAARVARLEAGGLTSEVAPVKLTAAGTVSAYHVVTSGGVLATIATAGHAGHISGIALNDAESGSDLTIAVDGQTVKSDAWTWTPGQALWVGTDGALATAPGTGAFQQLVGVALSATSVLVLIGEPVLKPVASSLLMLGSEYVTTAAATTVRTALGLTSAATGDAAGLTSGTLDPARLPFLPNGVYVYSDSDVPGLSVGQQADVTAGGAGTTVVTTDGELWSYTGSGDVTDTANYVQLSFSMLWGAIGGTLTDQPDLAAALALKLEDAPTDGQQYARMDGAWVVVAAAGGGTWGSISGTLADQTDLAAALGAKADTSALGSAAFVSTSTFATAAQGAKADKAMQGVASIVCSEALSAGDFVNVYDDAGTQKVRLADATTEGFEAHGYVEAAVAEDAAALVRVGGINAALSALTPGARYYLDTTAGAVTTTAPTASGNVVQFIGIALSETELAFDARDGIVIA